MKTSTSAGGHGRQTTTPPKSSAGTSSNIGCWAIAGIVALFAISQCGQSSQDNQTETVETAPEEIASSIATQSPPPVADLDTASIRKAKRHLVLAAKEALAGEMIYSQNCYDALGRHFSWSKLDVCGSLDIAAAQALGDDEAPGEEVEVAWFQSEAAAGRYLKAAVAAGEAPESADSRLADLQSRLAAAPVTLPKPSRALANEVSDATEAANAAARTADEASTAIGGQ